MIDTLIKIGKWQAAGMKPIEQFLARPKIDVNKTYYVAGVVFDLDEHNIYSTIVKKYSEKDPEDFLLLKTLPGNNKAIYSTVEKKKITGLLKSFFGKTDQKELAKTKHGELFLKAKETGSDEKFLKLLDEITSLKTILLGKIFDAGEKKIDTKKLLLDISINRGEDIALVTAFVKARDFGFTSPTPFSQINSYNQFVENNFLVKDNDKNSGPKLCYASGEIKNDVSEMKLETRYSLNKMFITETKNYATLFNKKHYAKNYQISKEYQKHLDLASTFLLEKYKVTIAGVQHLFIPTFLSRTKIDFDLIFDRAVKQTDYLFKFNEIKQLDNSITDWVNDIFWINFLSIDSDGNYFKSNDIIKDVSIPYFVEIIKTLDRLNNYLAEQYGSNTFYNFYQFYNYIPVKKGTNKNEALELFKDILEHRKVDKTILFKHFVRYIIVQRSGQFDNSKKHRAYANIREQGNFDFAIFNGVMTYLVFLKFLRIIKLLNNNDMEENMENLKPIEEVKQDYAKRVEKFFTDMNYNDTQKALFYLGRILSQVANAQFQKGHTNKPILSKLNYNGMDKDAIIRLRLDLAEKAKQYNIVNKVEYNFSLFTHLFNPNKPENQLTNEENVFYLLSGYSFGMIKANENSSDKENQEKNK